MRTTPRRLPVALFAAVALMLVIVVPTLAATPTHVWRARFATSPLHGGSTLLTLATGRDHVSVIVYGARPGTIVREEICAGPCTSANVIASLAGVKVVGTAPVRAGRYLTAREAAKLKAALAAKTAIRVDVVDGTTTSTGTFARVK